MCEFKHLVDQSINQPTNQSIINQFQNLKHVSACEAAAFRFGFLRCCVYRSPILGINSWNKYIDRREYFGYDICSEIGKLLIIYLK